MTQDQAAQLLSLVQQVGGWLELLTGVVIAGLAFCVFVWRVGK